MLPAAIRDLNLLERLDFNKNKVKSLPLKFFDQLVNLETLHMHSNKIELLPSNWASLDSLSSISMDWTFYTSPPISTNQN